MDASSKIQPSLEHMAVWVEDIDRTAAFLEGVLGWRRHPLDFGVDDGDTVYGGMRLAFVDANGLWLELVQPTTEGPGMEFLRQKGNGSLVELDFEVGDFDAAVAAMKARGIDLIGMDGKPLAVGGLLREWFIDEHGDRQRADELLSYLPFDLARGTSIELFWEYPTGVVLLRDRTWGEHQRTPRDTPRLDHAVILAADLEKTAEVYTDILHLPRHASAPGLRRGWTGFGDAGHAWIRGNERGMWLALLAPAAPEDGRALLGDERLGDGAILELAAEVADIAAFSDRMQAGGITMTAGDGTPLPDGQKSVLVESTGDRFAYFPRDRSEGLRILVFERGPAGTSAFTRRDS
jgi:catechol 2,3-dioxygenase-like lactoylglutathione lyase family enzyme